MKDRNKNKTKMERINNFLRQARIAQDSARIKFYSTLKGEVETAFKRGGKTEKEVIEAIAKKWNKNYQQMETTPQIANELSMLEEFLPEVMSEELMSDLFAQVKADNSEVFISYLDGNTGKAGAIMGMMMRASGGKADPTFVKNLIQQL